MTTTPTRFAFDRDAAAPIFRLIEQYHAGGADFASDAGAELRRHLTDEQWTMMTDELYFLDGFAPHADYEHGSEVDTLVRFAWRVWLTGPVEPFYDLDTDGDYVLIGHYRGEVPNRVMVTDGWTEVSDLINYADDNGEVEYRERNRGADAALDLLQHMVLALNDGSKSLDSYVAAQLAAQPNPYETLLNAVSTDFEDEVLEALRLKAGLLWKCPNDGDNNLAESETCDNCGSGRDALLGTVKVA